MTFTQSIMLLAIVPFLLLFFFLKKLERRRVLVVSSRQGGRTNFLLKLLTRVLPKLLWLAVAFAAIVSLAGPVEHISKEGIEVQGRLKCISLDFSYSMRETGRSKTGRSSVEVIKEVTMPFIDKRTATDLITVTVYGGKGRGPTMGDATILVRPTQNAEFIKKQIKDASPSMVGMYTSIGEGIFTCLSSMLDAEFETNKVDRFQLRESLEQDKWEYPNLVAKKIGRMRHMIIVLFTDGVNNAGIDPIVMVKFTRLLGIKIHFLILESTGATGISSEEEEERLREALREAIRTTGGIDFATKIAEDVEKHYDKIDKFEAAKVRLVSEARTINRSREWLWASLVLLGGFMLIEIVFLKLP